MYYEVDASFVSCTLQCLKISCPAAKRSLTTSATFIKSPAGLAHAYIKYNTLYSSIRDAQIWQGILERLFRSSDSSGNFGQHSACCSPQSWYWLLNMPMAFQSMHKSYLWVQSVILAKWWCCGGMELFCHERRSVHNSRCSDNRMVTFTQLRWGVFLNTHYTWYSRNWGRFWYFYGLSGAWIQSTPTLSRYGVRLCTQG